MRNFRTQARAWISASLVWAACAVPSLVGAQTTQLLWQQDLPTPALSKVVIADLNGGQPEIIVTARWGFGADLYVLNSAGGLIASVDGSPAVPWDVCVADIDGDGSRDVVVATHSYAYAFNLATGFFTGSPWSTQPGDHPGGLTAGDLNGDGADEIVGNGGSLSKLWVYDTVAGTPRVPIQNLPVQSNYTLFEWQSVAIADLEFDGTKELILVSSIDTPQTVGSFAPSDVYVLDGASLALRPGFPLTILEGWILGHAIAADLDGDYRCELAGVGQSLVSFFRDDGTPFGLHVNTGLHQFAQLAVGQLNADRHLEVVVPAGDALRVARHRFAAGGGVLSQSAVAPHEFFRNALIGDVDGDGQGEIVAISREVSGTVDPHLHVFEADLTPVPGWPKRYADFAATGATVDYGWEEVALADLNNDGVVDIVTVIDARVLAWTLYSGPPVSPIRPDWPQRRNNATNNNYYHHDRPQLSLFRRGDANRDGAADISDAISILSHLFLAADLACVQAGDVDDSGSLNLQDFSMFLGYLFGTTPIAPAPPFATCGAVLYDVSLPCPHAECP
ncbi:MAG: FG-GAP-like repeat-containing protein [Planctomycetota bacterium]